MRITAIASTAAGLTVTAAALLSVFLGSDTDENANRLPDHWEQIYRVTDPFGDADNDGWSNFAEACAGTDPTNPASRPAPSIRLRIFGKPPTTGKIMAYLVYSHLNSQAPAVTYSVEGFEGETVLLPAPAQGRIYEGPAQLLVWHDADGNGAYTPGEPYGYTPVEMGWFSAEASVTLTDTNPSIVRAPWRTFLEARDFATANAATDRGQNFAYYPNAAPANSTANAFTTERVRVRIIRTNINGRDLKSQNGKLWYSMTVLFDEIVDMAHTPMLSEGNVYANKFGNEFDLDWGILRRELDEGGDDYGNISNITYRIVVDSSTEDNMVPNQLLPVGFVNAFEPGKKQTKAVPLSPHGTNVASTLQFSWEHKALDERRNLIKDYPAFRFRIWEESGIDIITNIVGVTTNIATNIVYGLCVYDSGPFLAPPRRHDGVYLHTPPIYPGMVTPQGKTLAIGDKYAWSVSALDAKFMEPNADETKMPFSVNPAITTNSTTNVAFCAVFTNTVEKSFNGVATSETNIVTNTLWTAPFVQYTNIVDGGVYGLVTNVTDSIAYGPVTNSTTNVAFCAVFTNTVEKSFNGVATSETNIVTNTLWTVPLDLYRCFRVVTNEVATPAPGSFFEIPVELDFSKIKTSTINIHGITNMVHVQAFASPDFTGKPVMETYLKKQPVGYKAVAKLEWLPSGGPYYIRAYVDTKGTYSKGVSKPTIGTDPWGYAKQPGSVHPLPVGRGDTCTIMLTN